MAHRVTGHVGWVFALAIPEMTGRTTNKQGLNGASLVSLASGWAMKAAASSSSTRTAVAPVYGCESDNKGTARSRPFLV